MFKNIGKKIKGLVKVIFWIYFISFILSGLGVVIMAIVSGAAVSEGNPAVIALCAVGGLIGGAIVAGIGFLIAWIGSFFLYAYGQIADNTDKMAASTERLEAGVADLYSAVARLSAKYEEVNAPKEEACEAAPAEAEPVCEAAPVVEESVAPAAPAEDATVSE